MVLSFEHIGYAQEEQNLFAGLGFSAFAGSFLALRGPNGCGKTTLLKLLATLKPLQHGALNYLGQAVGADTEAYLNEMIFVGHQNGLYPDMTVEEHLHLWAKMFGNPELVDAASFYFGLDEVLHKRTAHLSAGWKRRTSLSRLLLKPQAAVWLLDEPFANLDKSGKDAVLRMIASKCDQGGIVIAAVHEEVDLPFGHTLYVPDFVSEEALC